MPSAPTETISGSELFQVTAVVGTPSSVALACMRVPDTIVFDGSTIASVDVAVAGAEGEPDPPQAAKKTNRLAPSAEVDRMGDLLLWGRLCVFPEGCEVGRRDGDGRSSARGSRGNLMFIVRLGVSRDRKGRTGELARRDRMPTLQHARDAAERGRPMRRHYPPRRQLTLRASARETPARNRVNAPSRITVRAGGS